MRKLDIRSARTAQLDRPASERYTRFQREIADILRILTMDELAIPDSLAFKNVFMGALLDTMTNMPISDRQGTASFLRNRDERWSRDQERDPNMPPVTRGEFNLFKRQTLIERAGGILGISPIELERRLKGTRPNTVLPEVLAYVIWATLAYSNGIVDHHNVDSLRGEYPWIPEFGD